MSIGVHSPFCPRPLFARRIPHIISVENEYASVWQCRSIVKTVSSRAHTVVCI